MRWYAPALPVLACGVAALACALPTVEDGSIQTSVAANSDQRRRRRPDRHGNAGADTDPGAPAASVVEVL